MSYALPANSSNDDKLLVNRIHEWIYRADEKYITSYSFFLDQHQQEIAKLVLAGERFVHFMFYGGFEGSKRNVLCIYPEQMVPKMSNFPIASITIKHRLADEISHRDILGSLMAMQIKRDVIGDIFSNENGEAYIFVYKSVAQMIVNDLIKVGRVGVTCKEGADISKIPLDKFKLIEGTVSSLRVDSCLSFVLNISREKSLNMIKGIGISINHIMHYSPSDILSVGDEFSVRGQGKFILYAVNGKTKKDRLHITIKQYV